MFFIDRINKSAEQYLNYDYLVDYEFKDVFQTYYRNDQLNLIQNNLRKIKPKNLNIAKNLAKVGIDYYQAREIAQIISQPTQDILECLSLIDLIQFRKCHNDQPNYVVADGILATSYQVYQIIIGSKSRLKSRLKSDFNSDYFDIAYSLNYLLVDELRDNYNKQAIKYVSLTKSASKQQTTSLELNNLVNFNSDVIDNI